jgi:hypothetical protein
MGEKRELIHAPAAGNALQRLSERLNRGNLTVWATLKEDTYETTLGDGYYAYLDGIFATPSQAAAAVEAAQAEPDAGSYRWHIRRYDLRRSGSQLLVRPSPTRQEPVTVGEIAQQLASSGLI